MKPYTRKNQTILNFDKKNLFSSYEYYCKITQQKIVGKLFFVIKPKLKLFLENRGHPFLDIDQSKISDEPHWILTVGTIGSLEGIARLDTIWEQFA